MLQMSEKGPAPLSVIRELFKKIAAELEPISNPLTTMDYIPMDDADILFTMASIHLCEREWGFFLGFIPYPSWKTLVQAGATISQDEIRCYVYDKRVLDAVSKGLADAFPNLLVKVELKTG
jgi:hypothetical protein